MEGPALVDAFRDEDKILELLRTYEDCAERSASISEKATYLLNAAYLSDKRLGLRRKALKILEKAENVDPLSVKIKRAKAALLLDMEKGQESLEVCKQAIDSCTLATDLSDLEAVTRLMAGPQRPSTPPNTEANVPCRPVQDKVATLSKADSGFNLLSSKDQYLMAKFPLPPSKRTSYCVSSKNLPNTSEWKR
eukprot:jgi/Botrbrau1/6692/Bobra.0202s0030.1